ncbi:MAG: CHAT domain-containing protein [Desulfomonile tiedjei]|uniref:CHAT domain-containing protein n=1 Tax=Desulfomonile tiedjei TaxID=2358 RepID=A0A9D6V009_9BACT|nr:CHAT domain-containing protein [Desulfomonile tiedjei]
MFLGFKHIIEELPPGDGDLDPPKDIDGRPLTAGVCFNWDIDQDFRLEVVQEQDAFWKRLQQHHGVRLTEGKTSEDVVNWLKKPKLENQILYFFCHAESRSLDRGGPDSSAIELTGGKQTTLRYFKLKAPADRFKLAGSPLVFINGCQSASMSPLFYDGWVPYFLAKGARGVMGPVWDIPAVFASEWAIRLFNRLVEGPPIGEAMLWLRREFLLKHNNLLGLAYSLYCDGETRIHPALR